MSDDKTEVGESFVEGVVRRAKVLGWEVDPSGEAFLVVTPSGGSICYSERHDRAIGTISPVCKHEQALLEQDGDSLDTARSLIAEIGEIKARASALEEILHRLIARLV